MLSLFTRVVCWGVRRILSLRYRVEFRGLDLLDKLDPEMGTLLLANHPAHVDPIILVTYLWPKIGVRPTPVETVYRLPVLHWFFKHCFRAISIPNFQGGVNSYKMECARHALQHIVDDVAAGGSVLLYPAGRIKRSAEERIGGASAAQEIASVSPDAQILLVRTTGLWGSLLSWGVGEQPPDLGKGMLEGMKYALKSLLFFLPRRNVVVELEKAPADFPQDADLETFNRWLENWYNRPVTVQLKPGEVAPEPLALVSHSCWHEVMLKPRKVSYATVTAWDALPQEVRSEVARQVARVAKRPVAEIEPEMHLFNDLNLDSLDQADLKVALQHTEEGALDISLDMMTVGSLASFLYESKRKSPIQESAAEKKSSNPFKAVGSRPILPLLEGETIPELFLNACDRMGNREAASDRISGTCTYRKLKERVVLLAEYFRNEHTHETRIGIMLPASIAVQVVILAVQLSGRIPVMINWTVGVRSLESMYETAGVKTVVTSLAFLDRLDGADLTPLHKTLLPLEKLAASLNLWDLLKAKWLARRGVDLLSKRYNLHLRHKDDHAAILFTSGTEANPKAVPLSHNNILSNLRSALKVVQIDSREVFLSMLPPFHSFGFSITGFFPLLVGIRVLYTPDPTKTAVVINEIKRSQATLLCAAPSFLRQIVRLARPEELASLRLVVTGAEKAPQELFDRIREIPGKVSLLEGYGVTECAPIITMNTLGEEPCGVGRPLEGVELRIVDPESYALVAQGEHGLVLVRGPNVFDAYMGEEAPWPFVELEEHLWYNTGDIGYLNERGCLTLEGRLKRFVKMGGEMISLPALEESLLEYAQKSEEWRLPTSKEAVLAVVDIEKEGERAQLHLFANFSADLDLANDALRKLGFSNLARLTAAHQLDEMPRLGTGKYDYQKLQQMIVL